MITNFKIYENYNDIGLSDIESHKLFLKKLHQLFNEFINLKDNKKDNLSVYGTTTCIIENDNDTLFKCGTEEDLGIEDHTTNRFIIAYQTEVDSPIWDNLVILENHILKEIRKYIEINMSDDDGIKFDISELPRLKNIKFNIGEVEMEIEANKYNL